MITFRWGSALAVSSCAAFLIGAIPKALAEDQGNSAEGYSSSFSGQVPFVAETMDEVVARAPLFAPPAGIREVPNVIARHFPGAIPRITPPPDRVQEFLSGTFLPGPGENGWTPGDPEVAVGPSHYLCCINGAIAIYNKTTGQQVYWVDNANFFSGLGISLGMVFDPRCFYDQYSGRWFINYPAFKSDGSRTYFAVACSATSNPTGTWYKWLLDSTNNGSQQGTNWSDYPGMGYTDNALAWTANMYPISSGSFYGKARVAAKQQFVNGSSSITYTDFWNFGLASMQPGRNFGSVTMPLIAAIGGSTVDFVGIQNPTSGSPTLTSIRSASGVQSWGGSSGGVQPGTTAKVDTLDGRIFDMNVRNMNALVTHNIAGGAGSAVRWYEVNCNGMPNSVSLVQQNTIAASGACNFYGAPQKNGNGDIGTAFTQSSSTEYVSLYYTGRASTDPTGTMRTPSLKKASTVSYGSAGNTERWGDYCGAAVDPTDDLTFWTIGMLPNGTGSWTTEVYSYAIPGGAPTEVTYNAESVTAQTGTIISGNNQSLWTTDSNYFDYMSGIIATYKTGNLTQYVYGSVFYAQFDVGTTNKIAGNVDWTGIPANPGTVSVKVLNVITGRWETCVPATWVGTVETALTGQIPGTASDHVSSTHKVKVQVVTNCSLPQPLNTNLLRLRMVTN